VTNVTQPPAHNQKKFVTHPVTHYICHMGLDEIRKLKASAGMPKEKKYFIPPVSEKRQAKLNMEKENRGGEDTELLKWYKRTQKQLTGKCARCGYKYNHHNLTNAIRATAHILAKRDNMFPSVATHPLNFIELPPYCGCHNWYDNLATWEEIKESVIWPIVRERFLQMEPDIQERSKIPDTLLNEIKPPF
jgi:hypothetical protein